MSKRPTDRSYHEARARDELRHADQCTDAGVAGIHRELAALHRRRMMEIVHLGEPQVDPQPLIGGRPLMHDVS